MVRTLDEMASKGSTKLTTKATTMASSWAAAKTRMKAGYATMPFGPTRKGNYDKMVDAATYRAPDPAKWSKNWKAKMGE